MDLLTGKNDIVVDGFQVVWELTGKVVGTYNTAIKAAEMAEFRNRRFSPDSYFARETPAVHTVESCLAGAIAAGVIPVEDDDPSLVENRKKRMTPANGGANGAPGESRKSTVAEPRPTGVKHATYRGPAGTVTVYYSHYLREYTCRLVGTPGADYFTDDYDDMIGTALAMVGRPPKVEPCTLEMESNPFAPE